MSRIITSGAILTGSLSSIGGTALQLTGTSFEAKRGVTVRASSANSTGKVYVGQSGVTAGVSAAATDGYELAAAESHTFEIDDPSKLYVIGSTTSLSVSFIAV